MRHKFLLLILATILALAIKQCRAQTTEVTPPTLVTPELTMKIVSIPDIPNVSRVDPPEIYYRWWTEVQTCTGLTASKTVFDKLEFYMVYADAFVVDNDTTFMMVGLATPWNNRIHLTITGVSTERLVKHEMTHILMFQNGLQPGHPDMIFKKCNLLK